MGINRNVKKLRMKLTPLVVPEWTKDEIDFYTPAPAIHKADLHIENFYSLTMTKKSHEVLFLQLCDNAQTPS